MSDQLIGLAQNDNLLKGSSAKTLELVKTKSAIDLFICNCSHSLRAPLKSITGLVHLLKYSNDQSKADPKLFLEAIEKTVQNMESQLTDMEQFLYTSRQGVAVQSVKVEEILDHVLSEFLLVASKNLIDIRLTMDQGVPFYTDRNQFQVILSQVISNAIHFRDHNKNRMTVTIDVKVTLIACIIRVEDNGVGISKEALPNIFELFYQGSEKSNRSGAGLYIVREVLNRMKGTINVQSIEGKGTTCTISIPNKLL